MIQWLYNYAHGEVRSETGHRYFDNNNPNPNNHSSETFRRPKHRGANIPTLQGARRTHEFTCRGPVEDGWRTLV